MNKIKEKENENERQKVKKEKDKEKDKSKNQNGSEIRWFIQIFFTTFILSIIFSFISTNGVSNLDLISAILILIGVIVLGICFDIVAVAVTVANEHEFHAKATKKVKGSKNSIKLIKNAPRVSNICADVIGDICGVLSGAISALISIKITESMGFNFDVQFILSALVAAFTVGGKAIGKGIANKHATAIVHRVGIILHKFNKNI